MLGIDRKARTKAMALWIGDSSDWVYGSIGVLTKSDYEGERPRERRLISVIVWRILCLFIWVFVRVCVLCVREGDGVRVREKDRHRDRQTDRKKEERKKQRKTD